MNHQEHDAILLHYDLLANAAKQKKAKAVEDSKSPRIKAFCAFAEKALSEFCQKERCPDAFFDGIRDGFAAYLEGCIRRREQKMKDD